AAFLDADRDAVQSSGGKDIIWRARTEAAIPLIAQLATDDAVDLDSRLRYFRAFDFIPGEVKTRALLDMIQDASGNDYSHMNKLIIRALDAETVKKSPLAQRTLRGVLDEVYGTTEYIELVARHEQRSEVPRLLELAISQASSRIGG